MSTNLILQLFGLFCGGIFILAFAGAGVFLLVNSFKDRKKAEASQGWPATQGVPTLPLLATHPPVPVPARALTSARAG